MAVTNGEHAGDIDPQAVGGAILGGLAGRMIGKKLGGKTGKTIGGWAGRVAGGFLPFSAEGAAGGEEEPLSDIELQGFMSTLRKVAKAAKSGAKYAKEGVGVARQIADVAGQLGVLEAGAPEQAAAEPEEQLSDIELQGFMSTLRKVAKTAKTGVRYATKGASVAKQIADVAGQLGVLEAGAPQQAGEEEEEEEAQLSDIELQGFMSTLRKVGRAAKTGVRYATKGADTARQIADLAGQLGVLEAGPQQQPAAQQEEQLSDIELQGFVSTLRKAAKIAKTGVRYATKHADTAKQIADLAGQLGVLEAGPSQQQAAAEPEEQLSDIELQGFMSTLRKVGKAAKTGVRYATRGADTVKQIADLAGQLGVLEAGPSQQQAAAEPEEQLSDIELQGFMSTLRKVAKTAKTGVRYATKGADAARQIADLAGQLGVFEAGPSQQQAAAEPEEQLSEIELQGFMDTLKKVARAASTGAQKVGQKVTQGANQGADLLGRVSKGADQGADVLRQIAGLAERLGVR